MQMDITSLIGLAHYQNKNGLIVIDSPTVQKANETVIEILMKYSDFKTALFLSGGKTPLKLYEQMASFKKIKAGAVGQVDERFGQRFHKNSNELVLKESGILEYFENSNMRFYPMLEEGSEIDSAARNYDEALRFIFKYFPKSVGIMGMGSDGHTAGIPAIPEICKKMMEDQSSLVSFYEAEKYGARITMNFNALSMLDLIIVLVLGQEKRAMLSELFKSGGSIEDIEKFPGKFYLKPEIAAKTILITDQMI